MKRLTHTFTFIFVLALTGSTLLTNVEAQSLDSLDLIRRVQISRPQAKPVPATRSSAARAAIMSDSDAVESEMRPFDYKDEYYEQFGLDPAQIMGRHDGSDQKSIVEFIDSAFYRSVRVTETYPIFEGNQKLMFYADLGSVTVEAFSDVQAEKAAVRLAETYPIYAFPDRRNPAMERQARFAEFENDYYLSNPLGLSVIIDIEFTEKAESKEGYREIEQMIGANGFTTDGSFQINDRDEIQLLKDHGFITFRLRVDGKGNVRYHITKVLRHPQAGAVASDAFLELVKGANDKPMASEMQFVEEFECLRMTGTVCQ